MKWERKSTYHWTCGPYSIAVCKVKDTWKYVLWKGRERLGVFDSAEEARNEAATRNP